MKMYQRQQGYLLILAVVLIVIVGCIGAATAALTTSTNSSVANFYLSTQAFYLAESGVERALHQIVPAGLSANTCQNPNINNASVLGMTGNYAVEGILFAANPTTTLTTLMNTSATTASVASTSGYSANGGLLLIDKELMIYKKLTATSFIGLTRGAYGTAVNTHNVGTPVGQYQCNLNSSAGVTSLSSPANPGDPYGKRILNIPIAQQDGWIVGSNFNQNLSFARWNNPTTKQWNSAMLSFSNAKNLYGISMLSYIDGWAVGQALGNNLLIMQWNGSNWSRVLPVGGTYNTDLNSVSCISNSDCWAVGNRLSGAPTIVRYTGSTNGWKKMTTPTAAADLKSVSCVDTNNCWAVGTRVSNNPIIMRWNGSTWTTVTGLPTPVPRADLNSIACTSTTNCWAVGNYSSVTNAPLIMRWNGSNWTRTTPTVLANAALRSVSCDSATGSCWAVGNASGSSMYVLRYQNGNWTPFTAGISGNYTLYAVDCPLYNDCWMTGSNAFIMHWDGSAWTTYTVQGGSFTNQILYGIDVIGVGGAAYYQSNWEESF